MADDVDGSQFNSRQLLPERGDMNLFLAEGVV